MENTSQHKAETGKSLLNERKIREKHNPPIKNY